MPSLQLVGLSGLMLGLTGALSGSPALADVPLTRADVESMYNQVEFIPEGQNARPARLSDWLSVGDALRTALDARAELRFNDGSLARVGERATFWFVPNTRDFRLSNGTTLFLIPPNRGPSNIRTPSAVTGVQGTALVVRHIPQPDCDFSAISADADGCPGRTIVMVLTNSPKGPVEVTADSGSSARLSAGDLAVIENGAVEVMEFNLQLFYQTSPLVEGLDLDNPNFEGSGMPTDPVRQETWDGIQSQTGFEGRFLLNPELVALDAQVGSAISWLLPANDASTSVASNSLTNRTDNVERVENQMPARRAASRALMSSWFTTTSQPTLNAPQASVPGVVIPTGLGQQSGEAKKPTAPATYRPATEGTSVSNQLQRPVVTRPPATSDGISGGPVREIPTEPPASLPVDPPGEIPGGEVPGGEVPGGEIPGGEIPGGELPGGEMPFDPGGELPGGEIPGGEFPGSELPGGELPGGELPGGEIPGGELPGGEIPGGELPGGEIPGGELPGGEIPGGEVPGGETPGGEVPGGEAPSNELPGGEVPFDPAG
ncbi:MAG: FecR domain-containing protein [Cyanobacteria bacterium P01_F01_bin.56]